MSAGSGVACVGVETDCGAASGTVAGGDAGVTAGAAADVTAVAVGAEATAFDGVSPAPTERMTLKD